MTDAAADDLDWPQPAREPSPEAALLADIQAELTELRGITMRFARRLDRQADTEEGKEDLARLNNSAVKAARAVRQVAVLQLEIAGLRDQPGSRPAAAPKPANQNKAGPRVNGPKPCDYAWTHGDYTEYDDYTDWELETCREEAIGAGMRKIADAARADLTAFGRADVCGEAPRGFAEMVRAIPHPALDECLNSLEPIYAQLLFGKDNVTFSLKPATMACWEAYDADNAKYPTRRDSS